MRPTRWAARPCYLGGLLAVIASVPLMTGDRDAAIAAGIRRQLADGYYADAEGRAREWLQDLETGAGSQPVRSLEALHLLLEALSLEGKESEAEPLELAQTAVELAATTIGTNDLAYARSLHYLAHFTRTLGVESARGIAEESLGLRLRLGGTDHPAVGESHRLLADVSLRAGSFDEGRGHLEDALNLLDRRHEPDEPARALTLCWLGSVHLRLGSYDAAQAVLDQALALQSRVLRPGHPDIGRTLDFLASLAATVGDYTRARSLHEEGLAIRRAALGDAHPDVGSSINNLAFLHNLLGDFASAKQLLDRALERLQERSLADNVSVQNGRANLAFALAGLGEYEEAIRLYRRVLEIRERDLPPDHELTGSTLYHLARVLRARGDVEEPRQLLERALALFGSRFGPVHERVGDCLVDLGSLAAERGDLGEAEHLLRRGLEVRERVLGPGHPDTAWARVEAAKLAWERGEDDAAVAEALLSEEQMRLHLRRTVQVLPEREALRYESIRDSGLGLALTVAGNAARRPSASETRALLDAVVRSRALVLDEIATRHHAVLVDTSTDAAELRQRLDRARGLLGRLVAAGPGSRDWERYTERVENARLEMESLERRLAVGSEAYGRGIRAREVGLDEVLAALPGDVALVSYVRHPSHSGRGDAYTVIALPAGKQPFLVRLGSASEIDGLIRRWRDEVGSPPGDPEAEARYAAAAAALRRVIWDPVERHLGAPRMVVVVPDGTVCLVNFATLPVEPGRYLVDTGPAIHYLSAERDLARGRAEWSGPAGLLVVGGADFGEGVAAIRFAALPSALFEAEEVEAAFSRVSPRPQVTVLVGRSATEAAVRRHAPGSRILHLATHGYFVDAPAEPRALFDNALARSGLALAGANRGMTEEPADQRDDGLLTAAEVASLDLRSVDWVVLSGCETGVGPVQNGEGVLGLRRTFATAGARTLIASLWSVEDHAARRWVRALYEARIAGASTVDAVRGASAELLVSQRRSSRGTHPYVWGAFVAAGDWR
jgi:CHAT domain-containing protein/tetratricopeptide (TPR) repeat protein